jgi:hypothetical protein
MIRLPGKAGSGSHLARWNTSKRGKVPCDAGHQRTACRADFLHSS